MEIRQALTLDDVKPAASRSNTQQPGCSLLQRLLQKGGTAMFNPMPFTLDLRFWRWRLSVRLSRIS
jgi:hypothetical protein